MSKKDLYELIKDQQRQITKLSDYVTWLYAYLIKKENRKLHEPNKIKRNGR